MNLIEYGRIIVRRGWIAILLAAIAAVGAFFFSQTMTPVYRGTQQVLILPSRTDFGLQQAAAGLLDQQRAYLDSSLVARNIVDDLQLDFTPPYLRDQTTVISNRNNLTIQIDVDLTAPDDASAGRLIGPIVAAWSQELIEWRDEQNQLAQREDRVYAQVQDDPIVFKRQPNTRINLAIGSIGGFFLGVVIILVLEYLESNLVRRREDVGALDIPVLAAVPHD